MSVELGTGHLAVLPSFRGFRRAMNRETTAAGAEASRGFGRAMGKGSQVAGGQAGRGFARGFQKSASVDGALKALNKEVQAAAAKIGKARDVERTAAGRVRVAEAQLAEARGRYAAGSSQVIRAEERLAASKRSHVAASSGLKSATDRLAQAQRTYESALAASGKKSSGLFKQLGTDLAPLRGRLNAVTAQLGAFYRTSSLLGPVRKAVDGLSMGWTRVGGAIGGLGPVVFRPFAQGVADVAKRTTAWARQTVTSIPGVGRAFSGLGSMLSGAGRWFAPLAQAGGTVARSLMSTLGPIGGQVASSLGAGFRAAASAGISAATSIGSAFSNALGGVATAAVAGLVASVKGGFDRLASVETATAKMRGFGLATATVDSVMSQVKDSVQGTVYSVGEMGNAAAAAVLAGVAPGEKLEKYMGLLKNTATAAGAPLNEIQSIFGKIVANVGGPVTTELNQLTDRGIPAWTILAEKMGLSVAEVKDLASEGKITSDVIVEHLGGAMSTMAEEVGGTTVSALQRMRTSFSRFGEALLKDAFPGVKAVADAVRAVMDAAIALVDPIKAAFGLDTVGPAIEKINGFTERVQAFTDLIKSGGAEGESVIARIVAKVQELAPAFGAVTLLALPLMGSFLSSLPLIGSLFAGLGGGIMAGLGPLLAGGGILAMIGMDPASFSSMIGSLVPTILGGLSSMLGSLTGILGQIVPVIVSNLAANAPVLAQGFLQLLTGLAGMVSTVLPQIVSAVVALIPAIVSALVSALPALIEGGIQLVLALVQGLVTAIPQLISAVVAAIPQIITAIVSAIPQLLEGALQLFLSIVDGLVTALPQIITAVVEAIPQIILALVEQIPSLIEGAISLFLGIIDGLLTALPQIITALIGAVPQIITALVSMLPQLITGAVQLFLGIVTGLVQAIPQIISAVINMIPQIVKALIDAVPQLLQAGVDLIRGLVQGISQSAGMVMDAIGGVVNGAVDWAKGLLGIKSPSRVFMRIGDFVGQGLSKGLDGSRKRVASAAGALVDATRDAFRSLEDPVTLPTVSVAEVESSMRAAEVVLRGRGAGPAGAGGGVTVEAPVSVRMMERDPRRVGREIIRGVVEAVGAV